MFTVFARCCLVPRRERSVYPTARAGLPSPRQLLALRPLASVFLPVPGYHLDGDGPFPLASSYSVPKLGPRAGGYQALRASDSAFQPPSEL